MNRKIVSAAALATLGLIVAACAQKGVEAPTEPGVCYHVVLAEDGKSAPQVNVVARDQPQIEFCAARLEEMRLRFLRLVPRRVEQSNDNTRFRTLAQQDRSCQFPELGR